MFYPKWDAPGEILKLSELLYYSQKNLIVIFFDNLIIFDLCNENVSSSNY